MKILSRACWALKRVQRQKCKKNIQSVMAPSDLQPHYGNGVFGKSNLSTRGTSILPQLSTAASLLENCQKSHYLGQNWILKPCRIIFSSYIFGPLNKTKIKRSKHPTNFVHNNKNSTTEVIMVPSVLYSFTVKNYRQKFFFLPAFTINCVANLY